MSLIDARSYNPNSKSVQLRVPRRRPRSEQSRSRSFRHLNYRLWRWGWCELGVRYTKNKSRHSNEQGGILTLPGSPRSHRRSSFRRWCCRFGVLFLALSRCRPLVGGVGMPRGWPLFWWWWWRCWRWRWRGEGSGRGLPLRIELAARTVFTSRAEEETDFTEAE